MTAEKRGSVAEVFGVAFRLGLTSFGGPVAHIATFRDAYFDRLRWVDERAFAELVAVTSLLPGPSSSQLGIAIGALRAGKVGGVAAWLGFTLPSAVVMTALGLGLASSDPAGAGWLHGLELAAVAVVLTALLAMRRALAQDIPLLGIAAFAATVAIVLGGVAGQLLPILGAALAGTWLFSRSVEPLALAIRFPVGRKLAIASLVLLATLLAGLPVLRETSSSHAVALVDAMVRAGSLVFGGGHVVLPLLDASIVGEGWVSKEDFVAGYGAVQAMPGPLFTFSAYLGAAGEPAPNGVPGAALALGAIFLPSFLLLAGVLPLWHMLRRHRAVQGAVSGVGAAVVGLLAAAFWDPVLRTAIESAGDAAAALALFVLLRFVPVWGVVALAAAAGAVLF